MLSINDIDHNIEENTNLSTCKIKELSIRLGSILIGTIYAKELEIDSKFFSCCNGKEVLFRSSIGVRSCGVWSRFLRLKALFKEFSLFWNIPSAILYKKAFMINSMCFSKEKQDFSENKQALYIDKKYFKSFIDRVLSFENKQTLSSLDLSYSYLSLYLGIFFLWKLDYYVHFIKIGSYFKEYLDLSKLNWFQGKNNKNLMIVFIDEKYKLEDALILERVINFCYNYNVNLIIIDSSETNKQEDLVDKNKKDTVIKKKSFFTKKISSIKEKKLISLIDKNSQSKLYQLLKGN